MVVIFIKVRAEARVKGRQGRHKGRKAQDIQKEDKIRGKGQSHKQKAKLFRVYNLHWPIKPTN